jgi:hypothetical protein
MRIFLTGDKGAGEAGRDRRPGWWSNCDTLTKEVQAMALHGHIQELTEKHKKLEELIEAEMAHPDWNEVRVAALKKEKLRIKDELQRLRSTVH